jgi:hypothetical protein
MSTRMIRLWKCPSHCANRPQTDPQTFCAADCTLSGAKIGERSGTWAEGDRLRSQVLGWLVIVKGSKYTARLENISSTADCSLTFLFKTTDETVYRYHHHHHHQELDRFTWDYLWGADLWHRTSPVASHSIRHCLAYLQQSLQPTWHIPETDASSMNDQQISSECLCDW